MRVGLLSAEKSGVHAKSSGPRTEPSVQGQLVRVSSIICELGISAISYNHNVA